MACCLAVVGWGWLPVSVVFLMTSCIFVTYGLAVSEGDVAPLFPYISDAGAELPQSAIFAQFLNVAACAASATLFMRYKIIRDLTGEESLLIYRLSAVNLVLGILASFGLSLVGNFQLEDNKLPVVHFTGASLVFGFGGLYCYLDTIITYKMAPQYNSRCMGHIRAVISVMGSVGFFSTLIAGFIGMSQWTGEGEKTHWPPDAPGYTAHLTSTFGEWVMAAAFILYFASQIRDFSKVDATFHVKVSVSHLSQSRGVEQTTTLMDGKSVENGSGSAGPTETTSLVQSSQQRNAVLT